MASKKYVHSATQAPQAKYLTRHIARLYNNNLVDRTIRLTQDLLIDYHCIA